ncbi:hypothetical protein SAMN02949497_3148 [Methylomagnum ishizawai]|uniref:DnaJ domain-containing protein n=1 Tax=Methylomagnum ishizawai TaxID=1760988 RepID=A0A1Y6D5Y2_9GAMM|nr:J domain-containing protein [Methylomagnum ishizawai]SMF95774.1 hypothetical protein SAMN02949497_3148 [Methylomagnum ishizawai]
MTADSKPVSLSGLTLSGSAPLTPDQKTFNRLIKQIEDRRARLAEWDAGLPLFRHHYGQDLEPLLERETMLKAQLAAQLDKVHDQKGVTQTERRKLSALIVNLACEVIEYGEQEEAMKALYNKYSQSDFDAEEAAQLGQMKSMFEDVLGVDLGDDLDLRSPEAMFERLRTQFQAQAEARPQSKPRKPSAKQRERETQREAEAKQLSQSLRDIYRKLASALHPDRESDPEESRRKTALMQRVNEAYERGGLLELLELQLQLEHIDPAHLANLEGQRLKHYIKILKDQMRELDGQLQRVRYGLAMEFGCAPTVKLSPAVLMAWLREDIATTEARLDELQGQLAAAGDVKSAKAWLKTITLRRPARYPDFELF